MLHPLENLNKSTNYVPAFLLLLWRKRQPIGWSPDEIRIKIIRGFIFVLLEILIDFIHKEEKKSVHWGDYSWGIGFWMGLGWLFMVIFWALVILGIIYLVKLIARTGDGKNGTDSETPLEILKKRYAKGEIYKEQFDQMKEDITKG